MQFKILEQLVHDRDKCLNEIKENNKKEREEIKRVTKAVNDKYLKLNRKKYEEVNRYNDELDKYCNLISSYSYFNVREIGTVVADLISVFEGANYTYQYTQYCGTRITRLSFDTIEERFVKQSHIVIEDSCKSMSYDDSINSLKEYAKKGYAIILADNMEADDKKIHFYYKDFNHKLSKCDGIDFGRLSYVKDFIDYVISYKMENKILDISYEKLLELEKEFISSRLEQIEENYHILDKKNEKATKLENEKKYKKLQRILERK